jgi:RNA ligase
MNYKFPVINNIQDVLQHIEGRSEFIVAEREFGTIINYVVSKENTFDMTGPDDLGGAIRRECRGMIFYPNGNIMSRPVNKFFNIGERNETQSHNLDFSQPHMVYEKLDGSMLRPIMFNDSIHWGTKMGFSDVAKQASDFAAKNTIYQDFATYCMDHNITPIFEYVGPHNKVVLDYADENMILLAGRYTVSGEYVSNDKLMDLARTYSIPVVGHIEPFKSANDLIEYTRPLKKQEGFVVAFANGHRVKIKAEEYVRIHKTKDIIRFDRNIADIIVNEQIDDLMSFLDDADKTRVSIYNKKFDEGIENVLGRIEGLLDISKVLHGNVKKDIALYFVPNLIHKEDGGFIFKMIDGKELRPMIIEHIKKNVGNTAKYDALAKWMGL